MGLFNKKKETPEQHRLESHSENFSKGSAHKPERKRNKMVEGRTNDEQGNEADIKGFRKPGESRNGIIQNDSE